MADPDLVIDHQASEHVPVDEAEAQSSHLFTSSLCAE